MGEFKVGDRIVIVQDFESKFWDRHYGGQPHSKRNGKSGTFVGYDNDSDRKDFGFRTDLDYHDRVVYEVKFHPQEIRNNKLNQLFT